MKLPSTERLVFRPWALEDLPLAIQLWGDPEVMALLDVRVALSREQVQKKLETEIERLGREGYQYWPMFERDSGDFVGCSGLKIWTYSARQSLETGFHLVKAKWGKGYALEAGREMARYAREELGNKTLMAGHHPKNESSRKVLTRLGFIFVGDVFFPPTGLMHPSYELRL